MNPILRLFPLALCLTSAHSPAATATWEGGGPFATGVANRTIHALAVSPDGLTVYAGSGSGSVFRYGLPVPVVGTCGAAHGVAVASAPAASLCAGGTASGVAGAGPWTWNCVGANGGATASCSAPLYVAPVPDSTPDPVTPTPTRIEVGAGGTATLTGTTPVTAAPGSKIVIPAGANVAGVAITLAGASGGGEAGPITFHIGNLVVTLIDYTPGTVASFRNVLVNGVETLVLTVTSGNLTLSGQAGQALLALNGTATLTAGTDGATVGFSANADGGGIIAVTAGHIVLSADAFAARKAARAAPADGRIYAGELASFDADGKIGRIKLGSAPGMSGGAGDALELHLAANLTFATTVPRLDASSARLGKPLQEALAAAAGAALVGGQTHGVLTLDIGGAYLHALPLGEVLIDTETADGAILGADGTATVAAGGVVARFAPSVADLGQLARDLAAVLPGATLSVSADGLLLAEHDGARNALRSDWISSAAMAGTAGFATATGERLSYARNDRTYLLHPIFLNFATLTAALADALPGATATTNADGTVAVGRGAWRWTLAPEMRLETAPAGTRLWWAEADGRWRLRYADGTAQGFRVE